MSFSTDRYLTLAVILAVAVFTALGLASLREGHNWGDDFALYILHARNLATGQPYGDIGFIQNPLYPDLAVSYAPPVTPAILSLVYAFRGADLLAMKAELFLFFSATLLLIFFYYRRLDGATTAALITAALVLNPYLWWFKENIVTEFVFLFFLWLSLLLQQVRDNAQQISGRLAAAVFAACAAVLATATREIGVVLVPAVILYDLVCRRRFGWDTVLFLVVFFVGYVGQSQLLGLNMSDAYVGEDQGYATLLFGWRNVVPNLIGYIYSLRLLFPAPYHLSFAIVGLVLALALFGLAREWLRPGPDGRISVASILTNIRFQDIVAAGYMLAICLQPFRAARYLFPVLPALFFYAFGGARALLERIGPVAQQSAAIVLAAIVLYSTAYFATEKPYDSSDGVHHPQSLQLFEAVRTQLPEDAVVIFRKPRAMSFYGQRRSAVWARPDKADERKTWENLAELGATHLVVPREASIVDCPPYLRYDPGAPPPFLEPVFANDHFTVYHILRFPRPDELASSVRTQ